MSSTNYVVGFMFRRNGAEVALIRKTKPDWQRGKLNGIGGKIENGETSREAMVREFREETGCETDPSDWRFVISLHYPTATVIFYETRAEGELKTTTDEVVDWFDAQTILNPINDCGLLPNLRWLIPLALDETKLAGVLTGA